jgi:hypothetical protein
VQSATSSKRVPRPEVIDSLLPRGARFRGILGEAIGGRHHSPRRVRRFARASHSSSYALKFTDREGARAVLGVAHIVKLLLTLGESSTHS